MGRGKRRGGATGVAPISSETANENGFILRGMIFGYNGATDEAADVSPVVAERFEAAALRLGLPIPQGVIAELDLEDDDSYTQVLARFPHAISLKRPFIALVGDEAKAQANAKSWAELLHSSYAEIDATAPDAAAQLRELVAEPVTVFVKNLPGSALAERSELKTEANGTQALYLDGEPLAKPEQLSLVFAQWPNQSVAPASWGAQATLMIVDYRVPGEYQYFDGPRLESPVALNGERVFALAQALTLQQDSPSLKQFAVNPRLKDVILKVTAKLEKHYDSFGAMPSEEQLAAALAETLLMYRDGYHYTGSGWAADQAIMWGAGGALSAYGAGFDGLKAIAASTRPELSDGLEELEELLVAELGPRLADLPSSA